MVNTASSTDNVALIRGMVANLLAETDDLLRREQSTLDALGALHVETEVLSKSAAALVGRMRQQTEGQGLRVAQLARRQTALQAELDAVDRIVGSLGEVRSQSPNTEDEQ